MSKRKYVCFDCGKTFILDYNEILSVKKDINKDEITEEFIENLDKENGMNIKKNICYECLEEICNKKNSENNENEKDFDSIYNDLVKELKILLDSDPQITKLIEENKNNENENLNNIENSINEKLKNEKISLETKLKSIENEISEEEKKYQNYLSQLSYLSQTEKNYWEKFHEIENYIYTIEKEKNYIKNIANIYEKEIKNFSNSNIISDLFQISFSDKYGTINGCRLVDLRENNYDEINAAFGYIILLTKILSIKFNFQSENFDIEVQGNYSKIYDKKNRIYYDVSISNLSRTLNNFNESLEFFLKYFYEFDVFLREKKIVVESEFKYKIENDKINDKSIKYEQNKYDEWCQCVKYLLTILKYYVTLVLDAENKCYKDILVKANVIYPQK
jgi:hypothetical protein